MGEVKPLPLYSPKSAPCVRSGACCKRGACPYGERTSEDDPACKYLEGSGPGHYVCGIAEEIVKDPGWVTLPAFGAGCCMNLFNEAREKVIRERAERHAATEPGSPAAGAG